MDFKNCNLDGIVICKPKIIRDNRGFFAESFRKDLLESFLLKKYDFCQCNISESNFGVLRGLHFQSNPKAQTKLISVQSGEILDVVLDLRIDSSSYGKTFSIILNDKNNYQLLIPKGFAHGFISLSKKSKIQYWVDEYFCSDNDCGINAFDDNLNIDWKLKKTEIIRSQKDTFLPDFNNNFKFTK
jgi:dTDP-4-dehydrorhamnose 3,5-epimerase